MSTVLPSVEPVSMTKLTKEGKLQELQELCQKGILPKKEKDFFTDGTSMYTFWANMKQQCKKKNISPPQCVMNIPSLQESWVAFKKRSATQTLQSTNESGKKQKTSVQTDSETTVIQTTTEMVKPEEQQMSANSDTDNQDMSEEPDDDDEIHMNLDHIDVDDEQFDPCFESDRDMPKELMLHIGKYLETLPIEQRQATMRWIYSANQAQQCCKDNAPHWEHRYEDIDGTKKYIDSYLKGDVPAFGKLPCFQ